MGCSLWGHEESDTTEPRGAVLGVEEEESAAPSAHCLTLSHCSPLASWPSSSIWRRPGPRRDSCLGTRSRGPRCAWCLTSSPAASSPCRCGSCVCGLPPFPRSCEPTLQHPARQRAGAGGRRTEGTLRDLAPDCGAGGGGEPENTHPPGTQLYSKMPQVSKDTSRGTTSLPGGKGPGGRER